MVTNGNFGVFLNGKPEIYLSDCNCRYLSNPINDELVLSGLFEMYFRYKYLERIGTMWYNVNNKIGV